VLAAAVATAVAATSHARPAVATATAYAEQDTAGSRHDLVSVNGDGDKSGNETRVQASTAGGKASSTAAAAVEKVNVFDGLVTADEVRVHASATDAGTSTSGAIVGLAINGQPQDPPGGRTVYDLAGYGKLVALGSGASGILGMKVTLTQDYKDNKAGSVVRIGYVSAKARDAVAAPAAKAPATTPARKATHKKKRKHHHTKVARRKKNEPPLTPGERTYPPALQLQDKLNDQELAWQKELLGLPGYAFPVAGDHNYTDTFGAGRPDLASGVHVGNDIFAAFGTPVVAVADGRLFRVGTLKISGNRLWLRDKHGFRYFYCHLSDFAAAAYNGADVHAGEVIGFVGNTGDAEPTPPHLHFEVHMPDDAVVDPYPYLQKWDQSGVTSASWLRRYGKDPGVRPGALVVVKDFLAEG
jgi:murein DD-endopeptidase MepM/ murein hydrolase activator NlpD